MKTLQASPTGLVKVLNQTITRQVLPELFVADYATTAKAVAERIGYLSVDQNFKPAIAMAETPQQEQMQAGYPLVLSGSLFGKPIRIGVKITHGKEAIDDKVEIAIIEQKKKGLAKFRNIISGCAIAFYGVSKSAEELVTANTILRHVCNQYRFISLEHLNKPATNPA